MNVIVCCEESQAVCIEFRKLGHNAYSCDLQKSSGGHPEWHFVIDCFVVLECGNLVLEDGSCVFIEKWDFIIGHPPCTYLSNAGEGWFDISKYGLKAAERWENRFSAIEFFFKMWIYGKKIGKVCLENPKGYINSLIKPSQNIEPYYFGDCDKKFTCLWLYGLDPLIHSSRGDLFSEKTWSDIPKPIQVLQKRDGSGSKNIWFTDSISGKDRQKLRSKTFTGIAKAMANQWG